eukprot:CAMPEP_0197592460 /NCGR_PEP_ID=MMETSP1326-20131121/15096_1 /TAXON_ID=1155430 /ORGANISM="Genus nov. species nov., Strain RCC2288" /LENGTH=245 /DNA_ID=CAMNT_0043158159 /DNA_START=300 /DNA_END=1037 /DNA_ORIENTATION=-
MILSSSAMSAAPTPTAPPPQKSTLFNVTQMPAPLKLSPSGHGLSAVIASKQLAREQARDLRADTEALALGIERVTVGDLLLTKKYEQRGAWLWVDTDASAFTAVKEMTNANVGALLVMKQSVLDVNKDGVVSDQELKQGRWDDAVAGIVSERDYLKKIVTKRKDAAATTVGQIMTKKSDITIASVDMPVLEAMQLMSEGRIRHMPVINHDRTMAGMLCLGDITRMVLDEHRKEVHRLRGYVAGGY